MTHEQAIHLIESALADLRAGDESALATLMRGLEALDINLGGENIIVGDISDAVGIAVGRNIRMAITQEVVALPEDIDRKLTDLLDALIDRPVAEPVRRHIRIFLSSPNDVGEERALAMKVVENLPYDPLLRGRVSVEVVAWDRPGGGTPLLATLTPQEAINQGLARPSECDIVVSIFWARMGTPLGEEYRKPDAYRFEHRGEWEDWRYLSGTEWEYVDAMQRASEEGRPLVVVYRRTEEPRLGLDEPEFDEKVSQYQLVKAFFTTFTDEQGIARRGVNFYEAPSDFAGQFELHLRDLIARLLVEADASAQPDIPEIEPVELWEGSPFPGLRAFGPVDAPIFFGRGAETDELVERLREGSFVAVVGASGSGKSSLVGAGLLPRLAGNAIPGSQDWRVVRFTPDELGAGDPFASLTAALRDDPLTLDARADELRAETGALVDLCEAALAGTPDWARVLLFVDQFEELFTRALPADREAFVAMLEAAAASDRMKVVVTLRGDFYSQALAVGALEDLIKGGTYPLYAPKRDALREMVERPAEQAGLTFERGLVRRILDDTGDDPGALALLAFALQQLYEERDGTRLTHAAYERFGGVQGAIGQQAQRAFAALDDEAKAALPFVFRELVAVSAEGTPTRRRAALAEVTGSPASKRLVSELTDKRLLVQSRGATGSPTVEVAHEALFRSWATLRDWIAEAASDLVYGGELLKDAAEWEEHGRHPDYLLRGATLERAREWLERAEALHLANDAQRAYIEASRDAWARQQAREQARRRRTVAGAFVAVVLIAGAVIVALATQSRSVRREADFQGTAAAEQASIAETAVAAESEALAQSTAVAQQQERAEALRLAALANTEFDRGVVEVAALLAIHSLKRADTVQGNGVLWRSIEGLHTIQLLEGHEALVIDVAFNPDGSLALTGSEDGTARLWDVVSGEVRHVLTGHEGWVGSAAFGAGGRWALTGGQDGTARLWDVASGQMQQKFEGHEGWVGDAAFSPDGTLVLTGSEDGTARLWDIANGEVRHVLISHEASVSSVAFSPDGRLALTGSTDDTARIWDVLSGETLHILSSHEGAVMSVAFGAGGRLALTGSWDGTARLWDVESGETRHVLEGHEGWLTSVAFSPDGRLALTGNRDGTARLWDVESGETRHVLGDHGDVVTSVAFSPDGRLVLTGSGDNTARLWDVESGKQRRLFAGHTAGVSRVAFSPDGTLVLTGSADGTVRLWNAAGNETRLVLTGHEDGVTSVAFNPDGSSALTASGDDTARLWDVKSGETRHVLEGHRASVQSVAFSPDGSLALTGSVDGTARLWDVVSGKVRHTLDNESGWATSVAFSPDGTLVLIGGGDGTARLWDVTRGQARHELRGHEDEVTSVAFSPDGRLALTGSVDRTARLWDVTSGQVRHVLEGHEEWLTSIAFSPDGSWALTGGTDGTARLWDLETGEVRHVLEDHGTQVTSVAFSPDGSLALTGGRDRTARLWDVVSGKARHVLNGHEAVVTSVAFSPNGSLVLTGSEDGTVRTWDAASGEARQIFEGHEEAVTSVAFSPDGRLALTGSSDGTARLWDVAIEDPLEYACSRIFRDLTDEERARFGITDDSPTCPKFGQ